MFTVPGMISIALYILQFLEASAGFAIYWNALLFAKSIVCFVIFDCLVDCVSLYAHFPAFMFLLQDWQEGLSVVFIKWN